MNDQPSSAAPNKSDLQRHSGENITSNNLPDDIRYKGTPIAGTDRAQGTDTIIADTDRIHGTTSVNIEADVQEAQRQQALYGKPAMTSANPEADVAAQQNTSVTDQFAYNNDDRHADPTPVPPTQSTQLAYNNDERHNDAPTTSFTQRPKNELTGATDPGIHHNSGQRPHAPTAIAGNHHNHHPGHQVAEASNHHHHHPGRQSRQAMRHHHSQMVAQGHHGHHNHAPQLAIHKPSPAMIGNDVATIAAGQHGASLSTMSGTTQDSSLRQKPAMNMAFKPTGMT